MRQYSPSMETGYFPVAPAVGSLGGTGAGIDALSFKRRIFLKDL